MKNPVKIIKGYAPSVKTAKEKDIIRRGREYFRMIFQR